MGYQQLLFQDQVVVIIEANNGLGRALALMYAKRGARLIIHGDCSSESLRQTKPSQVDSIVYEILSTGSSVIANYDSLRNPETIVKCAISNFGKIDVLVCCLGDEDKLTEAPGSWDFSLESYLHNVKGIVSQVWPIFEKNKNGKIVLATSGDGICGSNMDPSYTTSKMALIGFCQELAREGQAHNIQTNCYVLGPTMFLTRKPCHSYIDRDVKLYGKLAAFVFFLTHNKCKENGSMFEIGPRSYLKMELKTNISYSFGLDCPTSQHIFKAWKDVADADGKILPEGSQGPPSSLEGKVILVNNVHSDIGRIVANQLVKEKAIVVGFTCKRRRKSRQKFANEGVKTRISPMRYIQRMFGLGSGTQSKIQPLVTQSKATPAPSIDGVHILKNMTQHEVVNSALDKYKKIDVLINCSPDVSSTQTAEMPQEQWINLYDNIGSMHLISDASWGSLVGRGRIINICPEGTQPGSSVGMGMIGMSSALATQSQSQDQGISINTIIPSSDTQLLGPLVILASSAHSPFPCGANLMVGGGCIAQGELGHSMGFKLVDGSENLPEAVERNWWQISSVSSPKKTARFNAKPRITSAIPTKRTSVIKPTVQRLSFRA